MSQDQKIITRVEAKKLGLATYYTGTPCKHGNLHVRRASNGDCLCADCLRDRAAGKKAIRAKQKTSNKKNAG